MNGVLNFSIMDIWDGKLSEAVKARADEAKIVLSDARAAKRHQLCSHAHTGDDASMQGGENA